MRRRIVRARCRPALALRQLRETFVNTPFAPVPKPGMLMCARTAHSVHVAAAARAIVLTLCQTAAHAARRQSISRSARSGRSCSHRCSRRCCCCSCCRRRSRICWLSHPCPRCYCAPAQLPISHERIRFLGAPRRCWRLCWRCCFRRRRRRCWGMGFFPWPPAARRAALEGPLWFRSRIYQLSPSRAIAVPMLFTLAELEKPSEQARPLIHKSIRIRHCRLGHLERRIVAVQPSCLDQVQLPIMKRVNLESPHLRGAYMVRCDPQDKASAPVRC